MTDRWAWVSSPRATFGLRVRDGIVVDAAPISGWAIGEPFDKVLAWWKRKGADRARWVS